MHKPEEVFPLATLESNYLSIVPAILVPGTDKFIYACFKINGRNNKLFRTLIFFYDRRQVISEDFTQIR